MLAAVRSKILSHKMERSHLRAALPLSWLLSDDASRSYASADTSDELITAFELHFF